jgi:hypothetical protein
VLRYCMPLLVLIVLVSSVGVAHGWLTGRWGVSADLQRAAVALDRFPKAVGNWVAVEDTPYDADDVARHGIRGHVGRTFRHSQTGEVLQVLVVCGRGGPISVHEPDVCYAAAGYRLMGAKHQLPEPSTGATFWTGRFVKPTGVVPQQLDIYWAWSRDGAAWGAPDNPRVTFAWAPSLYKLYVVRSSVGSSAGDTSDSRVREFLSSLLPQLNGSLAHTEK